jgi:hypothetical protein
MSIIDYIAGDDGGQLDLNDRTILDGQATTINQNGVLFLAYMARACGTDNFTGSALTHSKIVSVGKGRYLRRKGDPLRQSHDNVLAWAWWSIQDPDLAFIAKDIYDFAKWRLYVYNPHHRYSLDIRCWLQPSQVFTLLLAAGRRPGWISTIWFCGACLVSDHASGPYLLSMLATDIVQARWALLSPLKQKLVTYAMGLLIKRRGKIYPWYQSYYQDQQNPSVIAAVKSGL